MNVCFSLTNYHAMLHPMRDECIMYYRKALSSLTLRIEEVNNHDHAR